MASAYYEAHGLTGVVAPQKIQPDLPYTDGHIGYHRRTGKHAMTPFDWQVYTDILKRI